MENSKELIQVINNYMYIFLFVEGVCTVCQKVKVGKLSYLT